MNLKHQYVSSDLALAIRHAHGVNTVVDCSDDADPELLFPGIEEEEEEEEEGDEDDAGGDIDDDAGDGDRGDDVDPGLRELDDDPDDADQDDNKGGQDGDQDGGDASDGDDDLDPDALAELAGEGGKAKMVPHARFNEVNESLKTERAERLRLEEELARAKGAKPSEEEKPRDEPKPYDFDAAEDRFMDAVLEGDKDKARQIRSEIRGEERKQYEGTASTGARESAQQELQRRDALAEQEKLAKVLSDALEKYPFLNDKAEEHSADAIEDVIARRDYYLKQGKTPSQAVAMAIEKVAPRYAPKVEDDNGGKPAAGKKPELTAAQVARNLERERRIPAAMPGVGERGKDVDYADLTEDEFDALPEAEKRKARGDFVGEKD